MLNNTTTRVVNSLLFHPLSAFEQSVDPVEVSGSHSDLLPQNCRHPVERCAFNDCEQAVTMRRRTARQSALFDKFTDVDQLKSLLSSEPATAPTAQLKRNVHD